MARRALVGYDSGVPSTIEGFLKEDYVRRRMVQTVNMRTYFMSRVKKKRVTGGRKFNIPVHFAISEGQGMRIEGAKLPRSGFGEYDQAFGTVKNQYGAFEVSGPAIAATGKSMTAFAKTLSRALKDCRDGFTLDSYRQVWGPSTGVMARVKGAVNNSVTVNVDTLHDEPHMRASLTPVEIVPMFRKNMRLMFRSGNNNVYGEIKSVSNTGTLTLKAAITLDDNAAIYRGEDEVAAGGIPAASNMNYEYFGIIDALKDRGTYLGIDRTEEPNWQGNRLGAGARDLANAQEGDDILQDLWETCEVMGNGMDMPDTMITGMFVRRQYLKGQGVLKRYKTGDSYKGGWTVLDYNGRPWEIDKPCPPEQIMLLRSKDFCWYYTRDVGWLNQHGTLLRFVQDEDMYRGYMRAYREFTCENPSNQCVVTGADS